MRFWTIVAAGGMMGCIALGMTVCATPVAEAAAAKDPAIAPAAEKEAAARKPAEPPATRLTLIGEAPPPQGGQTRSMGLVATVTGFEPEPFDGTLFDPPHTFSLRQVGSTFCRHRRGFPMTNNAPSDGMK